MSDNAEATEIMVRNNQGVSVDTPQHSCRLLNGGLPTHVNEILCQSSKYSRSTNGSVQHFNCAYRAHHMIVTQR